MPRHRHTNPSDKAKQSRVYRRNQRNQKRFEAPLKEFIEIKYKSIFQEYVALYNQMDSENPDKINLKKTEIFKQWKRANEQVNPDILSLAIRETIEQDRSETNECEANNSDNECEANNESEANNSDNEYEANNSDNEYETNNSDNEYDANNSDNEYEATAAENQEVLNEGMLAAHQVDALVNEMIIDDELRALLNTEPEDDEGIELNLYDELDIQDFDYRLEVELADW